MASLFPTVGLQLMWAAILVSGVEDQFRPAEINGESVALAGGRKALDRWTWSLLWCSLEAE